MHLLPLLSCLVLVAGAPSAAPGDGRTFMGTDVLSPVLEQEIPTAQEYLGKTEYDDTMPMLLVMMMTPQELEDLLSDMQEPSGEQVGTEEQMNQQRDDSNQEEDGEEVVVSRNKRQVAQPAMDLALSHTNRNGNNRRPGQIHGRLDLNGIYKNRNNHHTQAGVGLGSVIYRSNNGRHSVGVGAYGTQGRGRSYSYGYKTQPQWGAGVGYRFRF